MVVWGRDPAGAMTRMGGGQFEPLCHAAIPVETLQQFYGVRGVPMRRRGTADSDLDVEDFHEEMGEDSYGSAGISRSPRTQKKRRKKSPPRITLLLTPLGSLLDDVDHEGGAGVGGEEEHPPDFKETLKALVTVHVMNARNLPQTRTKIFGGKGCYPFVRLRIVRGNPLKDDEEPVEVVPAKSSYSKEGMNPVFSQRIALGPVNTRDKNMFVLVEVMDTGRIFPHEPIGQTAMGLHDIYLMRGVRPRKLASFGPSGVRFDPDGGGAVPSAAGGGGVEWGEGGGEKKAVAEDQLVYVRIEECHYGDETWEEVDQGLAVTARVVRATGLPAAAPFPDALIFAEIALVGGGNPSSIKSDDEYDKMVMVKRGG